MGYMNEPTTDERFLAGLKEGINEGMRKAAEPLLQKALVDIEAAMRGRANEIACGMVRGEIDIMRNAHALCITIKDHNPRSS